MNTNKYNFLRFLKDEKFIEWQLFPSDELTTYWESFLQEHPYEKENIALAKNFFQNIQLSSYNLSVEKKEEAIKKLEHSVHAFTVRKKIRRVLYTAAACAAILFCSILYVQKTNQEQKESSVLADCIIGSELQAESIRLITNNQTTTFQENIDIEISNAGIARVKTDDDNQEDISINKSALNTLIVPYGKRSTLILPDGSKVWLNSGSVLKFTAQFTGNNREIHLTAGEMFIEVTPNNQKPFYVHTVDFGIRVYGTKFNISSYANTPKSVVLVEGRVSLQASDKKETFLTPNEQAIYTNNGTFDTQKVDVAPFISWKEGYLEFDNTPIRDVLTQIERYYNLSFDYDKTVSLKGLTCTGKIVLSENTDDVMTTIALITSTKYQRKDNRIFITNESQ